MSKERQNITAVIFDKRGRVLSIGQNSYIKTHPLQAKWAKRAGNDKAVYLHAEIAAIVRCPDISKAHRMLVTRYNKRGQPVLAAPCKICQSAIKTTPIRKVDHT